MRLVDVGWLKFELITDLSLTRQNGSGRKFQYRFSNQAEREARRGKCVAYLPHPAFAVEVDDVYRKSHKKRVNAFARLDPEPGPFRQTAVFKQSGSALSASCGE